MKAPDKIYLLSTPYRFLSFWYDYESPSPDNFKQTEYIRKNALLEWAKDGLAHLENGGLASEIGAMTLQKVIDKLNSM